MNHENVGPFYRFSLTEQESASEVLQTLLAIALKETELLFGKARLKLETSYELSTTKPVCIIEGGTDCGAVLAKLLSGFLLKQVGETGFRVERLPRREEADLGPQPKKRAGNH